jgi:non-canonical poly(A) RNA polymerase PAPD5/7
MHPKVARKSIDPLRNLGVLLMDMFQLYGINFNIDSVGIDVRGKGSYYLKVKYLL